MGSAINNVIEFARANGGVFTRQEAAALGLPFSTLSRRTLEGVFARTRRGVYALPGFTDEHLLDLHIACRKLGAVASHQSAAYIHNLDRPKYVRPTVSVYRNRTKDLQGVTVHQMHDFDPAHIVEIDALPVTGPHRTIFDLASVITEDHLARVVDHGLASRRLHLDGLYQVLRDVGRRGKPGTGAMRKLLDTRSSGYVPPESELERRLLNIIERDDLPPPVRQFQAPWLKPINGRVDLAYPDRRLLIEGDSRRWHQLARAFETDRLRDNAAQLAGWRMLRFTWEEIKTHPERVVATIRKALEDERF